MFVLSPNGVAREKRRLLAASDFVSLSGALHFIGAMFLCANFLSFVVDGLASCSLSTN